MGADALLRLRDSLYAPDLLIAALDALDFFTRLDRNPSSLETLIAHFQLAPRPAEVMMSYFQALGLVSFREGRFEVSAMARRHLVADAPESLVPYFLTQKNRPTVTLLIEVLRTGIPAGWGGKASEPAWSQAMEDEDFARNFTAGMDSRGAYYAPALASGFDFSRYGSLLDIAGGSGIYAAAIRERHPHLEVAVLERPPVDAVARSSLARKGLSDRVKVLAGDLFGKDFPAGFDLHLFSHVFHDWGLEDLRHLVRNSFQALNPEGRILIFDAHLHPDKAGPLSVAEYSVLLLVSTPGRCYSSGEMEELLASEGFSDFEFREIVGNRSLISARKSHRVRSNFDEVMKKVSKREVPDWDKL